MAKERRDNKNRILSKGEYQKPDGRYMYRYTDANGQARFAYSWTLTKTDRIPKGKPSQPCLRDIEKQIATDLANGVNTATIKKKTLNDYFDLYMSQKRKLKPTTRANYIGKYNLYVRDTIGNRKIADIKYSDIKQFYNQLVHDDGRRMATMLFVNSLLSPVFRLAERDGCIRKNPITGAANEIKSDFDYSVETKQALTLSQQENFIRYIHGHKVYQKWYSFLAFLLGTGCRIGEACALTWDDCDFDNNLISINKNLRYTPSSDPNKYEWLIATPKTKAGIREIPMMAGIKEILKNEKKSQMMNGFNVSVIDGVSGFVFMGREKKAIMPRSINSLLIRIVDAYNEEELELAVTENRQPELLPHITPHIFRHTFCTRLFEYHVDPKVIQEIMGHATLITTQNVYNNLTIDYKKESIFAIERKFKIG